MVATLWASLALGAQHRRSVPRVIGGRFLLTAAVGAAAVGGLSAAWPMVPLTLLLRYAAGAATARYVLRDPMTQRRVVAASAARHSGIPGLDQRLRGRQSCGATAMPPFCANRRLHVILRFARKEALPQRKPPQSAEVFLSEKNDQYRLPPGEQVLEIMLLEFHVESSPGTSRSLKWNCAQIRCRRRSASAAEGVPRPHCRRCFRCLLPQALHSRRHAAAG